MCKSRSGCEPGDRSLRARIDSVFVKLPPRVREAIESKIHQLGSRLGDYPHQRLTGRAEYRLRAGDYRIIYEFNREENILYLLAVGNRREIYR